MWNKIINVITNANNWLNNIVWGWPMIVMILGTGLLITVMTRAMQIRKFGESMNTTIIPTLKSIGKKNKKKDNANSISQFEAFSAAISGTVGTGNIIGVTSAIMTGGPGAVFWMWISAFFGMITNYAENVLGLFFRKKDENGDFKGGAFYYLANGLKWKKVGLVLGYFAAAFCLFAAVSMSGVQTNKITGTITEVVGNNAMWLKLTIGIIVAAIVAVIIIGGIKRIGKIASMLVPFMSLLFIILALIIIAINITAVPAAFALIFKNIFGFKAVAGGIGGYVFSAVIKKGMARGVFSNEAGLGSSVIAHSASETREPVKQGMWGIFEVFFDTFVICTLTALVVLVSYSPEYIFAADTQGNLVHEDAGIAIGAFANTFGMFGSICFAVILPLFAFTTIIAWSYYGEKATEFCFQWLGNKKDKIAVFVFKIIYVVLIIFSAVIESELVWALSDTANGLMAIPNLIAVVCLSGLVVKITKNYYDRKKGLDVKPMMSAYDDLNEEFIQYESEKAAAEASEGEEVSEFATESVIEATSASLDTSDT